MLKKMTAAAAAAVATVTMTTGVADATHGPRYETVVDAVVAASGAPGSGFDHRLGDYDVLREALVATGLVEAVATAEDITVFAPNDRAFVRLARDLGYDGWDEAGAFAAIAEATGFVSADEPGLLDDVLLYHVAPDGRTVRELRRAGDIPTLLDGASVHIRWRRVVDADTSDRDAYITWPSNVETGNGVAHTVSRVLRPIDLP